MAGANASSWSREFAFSTDELGGKKGRGGEEEKLVHWKRPLKANSDSKKRKRKRKKKERERGRKEKYIIVKMYRTYEIRAKGFLFLERSQ